MPYAHRIFLIALLSYSFCAFATDRVSTGTGPWTTPGTWSPSGLPLPGDNITILAGHIVTMDGNAGACNSLTIDGTADWAAAFTTNVGAGGIIVDVGGNVTGAFNGILTTTGGLTLNSTLTSTQVTITIQTTAGQTISGTGSLARLTINATTTNSGNITVTTALGGASTLTQGSSASLSYGGGGAIAPSLDASASGNTVDYNGTGAQTVKTGTYYNLTISGAGTSTLGGVITVSNNLNVSGGTLATSTFQITGNATGTLNVAAGAGLTLGLTTSASIVDFPTNFTTANITLNATSTVTYQGNYAQNISTTPASYGNLTVSTGAATVSKAPTPSADMTLNGNLTLTNGAGIVTLDMGARNLSVTGTISSTGSLTMSGGNLTVSGSFTNTGTFTPGAGLVLYNGSGAQTIKSATYQDITLSNAGACTLGGAITVNGSMNISAGSLATSTFQITGNATGTFTLASGVTLFVGLAASATDVQFPTSFTNANITLNAASTVTYQGNNGQTISSTPTYGNLTVNTFSGSKTANGTITVAGNLITTSPTTLDMTTYTLNLTGTYTSTGALSFSSGNFNIGGTNTNTGTFTAGTGTVNYNGGGAQTVRGVNYNNLTFSGAGTKTLQAANTIGIAGDFTRGAMTVTAGATNVVLFNGTTQNMTGSATTFTSLTMSNTSLTIGGDITINSTLTFTTGNIITGANNVILPAAGSVSRTSGHVVGNLRKNVAVGSAVARTFQVGTGSDYTPVDITFATVSVAGNLTISTTGSDHPQIASSGFTAASTVNRYWTMTNSGITFTNYDVTCTFVNTDKDGGLNTSACIIKTYNGSTWGTPLIGTQGVNSTQATTLSIPTSTNSIDLQIGENIGSPTGSLYSIATGNWSTYGTWSTTSGGASCGCFPTSLDDVVIENNFTVTMDGNTGAAKSLTIQTGGIATWASALTTNIGTGGINIAATGDIATGAGAGVLVNTGNLVLNKVLTSTNVTIRMKSGSGQTISGTGSMPILDVSANTTNNGSLTVTTTLSSTVASTLTQGVGASLSFGGTTAIAPSLDASASGNTVDYNGTGAQTVKTGTYYNLTISGAGTSTLGGVITVSNNLNVSGGTLATSTFQITGNATGTLNVAAGAGLTLGLTTSASIVDFPTNFTTANITLNATSTVTYQGNYAQNISTTPASYGNLTVSTGAATVSKAPTPSADMTLNGNLTLTNGAGIVTLDMGARNLSVTGTISSTGSLTMSGGNLTVSGSFTNTGTFTPGAGLVLYNGSGAQTIKSATYQDITLSNAGACTLGGAITVNGSMNISAGSLATSTFQITGNATGTFTLASGVTLFVGLAASATDVQFPTSFTNANITLNAASTVTYQGNNGQTISSTPTYGNLTVNTFSGSKTANGTITVAGNLITTSPTTLDMTTYTLNLTGTYTSTGALSFSSGNFNIGGTNTNTGTFTAGTGTVNYNGGGAQTVRGVNYNNLTFSGAGTKTLQAANTIGIAGDFTRGAMTVTAGATNVVLFNGTTQNMTGSATTFTSLTMSNTSLTIGGDITINSTLTFTTGNIITGANNVILPAAGSVSRTSGHVVGNLRKNVAVGSAVARTFQVGTGSDYTPVDITFATVSVAGNLTISTTGSDHPQIASSGFTAASTVNRYWTMTNSGITFTNYDVTCTFVNTDKDGGITTSTCVIRTYNGASWSSPAVGTQAANSTQATSVTTPTSGNSIDLQIGDNPASPTGALFSIATGNWTGTSTWSSTSGGASCNCAPTNKDTVYIESNFTVTMDGNTGSAKALFVRTGGIATWASALTTNIGTGGINIAATGDITTGAGAGILVNAGNLVLNKVLSATNVTIQMKAGSGQTISGTGSMPILDVSANTTNTGSIIVTTTLSSTIASTLTQGTASSLSYGGTSVVVPTLDATANGNTVDYNGGGAQTVKSTTYYNLTISNAGTSTLGGVITVSNNLNVSGGTLSGSTFQITGNATGTLTLGANTGLTLAGSTNFPTNYTTSNITLNSTSTVTYSGTGAQTIKALDYGTLAISGARTTNSVTLESGIIGITANTTTCFNPSATFTSGAYITTGNTVEFKGTGAQTIRTFTNGGYNNLTSSGSGARTLLNGGTISIAGTFTPGTNAYTVTGSTVDFNGSGSQNIPALASSNYNILKVSNAGVKTLTANVGVVSDLNISAATLDMSTFTANRTAAGGTLTVAAAATLKVGGTSGGVAGSNFPNNYTTNTLSGTVEFNGSGGQTIAAFNYTNLTSSSTGARTLASSGTIGVSGTFTIGTNSYTTTGSTVNFNGASPQTISSAFTFNNLSQNNSAGLSLGANVNLTGALTIGSGIFTATGFNFTLKSTASGTARIAAIPNGSNFVGNIIMERYTGSGPTDWRFFSSAVSGATIADWADDFATSGFTGSTDPTNSFVSIYSYNEAVGGTQDNGYVAATNVTNSISNAKGFWVYLGPNPTTYEVTGPPNTFTISPTVTYSVSAGAADDGWNMVANPYPSAIDWDDLNWTKTNLDDAVYIYNSSTGSFASYVAGLGVNGGSRYIASQQGFWVKANAAAPILTMVENVKASTNPSYLKTSPEKNISHYPMAFKDFSVPQNNNVIANSIRLTANGNGYDDETFIRFMPGATNNFDGQLDAWKMENLNPLLSNLSSVVNDTMDLSINSYPDLTSDIIIPIRMIVPSTGIYSIRRDSTLMLPMSSCVILEDLANGNMTDFRSNVSYSFTISDTTKAPRFLLHIYTPISKKAIHAKCSGDGNGMAIAKGTGTGPWNYVWKDSFGNIMQTKNNSSAPDTLFNLTQGIYSVEISGGVCGILKDTIVVNTLSDLSISSNSTNVSCNGMSDGLITVLVAGGNIPYTYSWNTGATTSVINVNAGNYSVVITDSIGCSKNYTTIITQPSPIIAGFTASTDILNLQMANSITFTNTSLGAIYYQWDFGDTSGIDFSESPAHSYFYAGNYTVTMVASDGTCSDTVHAEIVVVDSTFTTSVNNSNSFSNDVKVLYDGSDVCLSFHFDKATDVNIYVYNLLGEKIVELDSLYVQDQIIKLPVMLGGIYVAVAETSKAIISKKIFVTSR